MLTTSCRTTMPFGAVNLAELGWRVQQGQAVWRPRANRPELAGELWLATNTDGRCFLEFSKSPFAFATAQCDPFRWQIEFPPQQLTFAGRGKPPARFGWLHLCRALAGQTLARPWRFEQEAEGGWRLENRRTGERIEGYLTP